MIIALTDITYERYYRPVFRAVSLAVEAGQLCLLMGINGSGKTTLLRIMAGLLHPASGRVTGDRGPCLYVGHQLAVKEDLTVRENLTFMRGLNGAGGLSIEAALERLDIPELAERDVRTLSAGQRKRCALARLLISPARLWLLDEPYSNLDTDGAQRVHELVAEHLAGGGACVMCTHGALRPPGIPALEITIEPGRSPG